MSFFFPTLAFSKEFIIINDSLVIFSVMGLLLALLIKNFSSLLVETFNSTRETTQQDLSLLVKDTLKGSLAYQNKLEDVINLNLNRSLLLPALNDKISTEENLADTRIKSQTL